MASDFSNRYEKYSTLMHSEENWQKTLGVVTCKRLRDPGNEEHFQKVVELLSAQRFWDFVDDGGWKLAFTGGTFQALARAIKERSGRDLEQVRVAHELAPSALGVIQLANLVIYGHVQAILFFNDIEDIYADSPQNLVLRRICNFFETPLLEDFSSIEFILINKWYAGTLPSVREGSFDAKAVLKYFGSDEVLMGADLPADGRQNRSRETLAVVSHNNMKMSMLNFCLRHMNEILQYKRILATGTTGKRLFDQYRTALVNLFRLSELADEKRLWDYRPGDTSETFLDRKILRFESGPLGGDIQISSKVIDGTCHRVIFFQDPQTAHPHQFDIRLMEKAVQDHQTAVLFATSEETARLIV